MDQPQFPLAVPLACPEQHLEPAWIDYNGHLNMAYYHVLFDRALDHVYDLLGIGRLYVEQGGGSCFTLEVHVNYLSELTDQARVSIDLQLLDHDDKRLHFFQHMYDQAGTLAATSEQLALHVDMTSRRAAPFPDQALRGIAALGTAHAPLPRPERAGRTIGIRRKP